MPRALGGRAFGKRAVFVEVAEGDASLDAFGEALSRAIRRWGGRVALTPGGSTGVITLHGSFRDPGGRELLSLSVGEGPGSRRLVLHHPPDRREDAAMALLETLGADGH